MCVPLEHRACESVCVCACKRGSVLQADVFFVFCFCFLLKKEL